MSFCALNTQQLFILYILRKRNLAKKYWIWKHTFFGFKDIFPHFSLMRTCIYKLVRWAPQSFNAADLLKLLSEPGGKRLSEAMQQLWQLHVVFPVVPGEICMRLKREERRGRTKNKTKKKTEEVEGWERNRWEDEQMVEQERWSEEMRQWHERWEVQRVKKGLKRWENKRDSMGPGGRQNIERD